MEIYFAEPTLDVFLRFTELTGIKLKVLISYCYERGNIEETVNAVSKFAKKILLDSGGFTTAKMNSADKNLMRSSFYQFIKNNNELLDENFKCVFAFDDLSRGYVFSDNLQMYEDQHCSYSNIVPVIHNIVDGSKEIEEFAKFNPHTMAIGKCKYKTTLKYLIPTVSKIKSYGCRCHLLGVTDFSVLSKVDIDSCDSTSWMHDSNVGVVRYFGKKNNIPFIAMIYFPRFHNQIRNGTVLLENFEFKDDFLSTMKSVLNIELNDFYNNNQLESRQLANIYYTLEMEKYLRTRKALTMGG